MQHSLIFVYTDIIRLWRQGLASCKPYRYRFSCAGYRPVTHLTSLGRL